MRWDEIVVLDRHDATAGSVNCTESRAAVKKYGHTTVPRVLWGPPGQLQYVPLLSSLLYISQIISCSRVLPMGRYYSAQCHIVGLWVCGFACLSVTVTMATCSHRVTNQFELVNLCNVCTVLELVPLLCYALRIFLLLFWPTGVILT